DRGQELASTLKGRDSTSESGVLVRGVGEAEQGANDGIWKPQVKRDPFGAQVVESVFQVFPKRFGSDGLDGHGHEQAVLFVGITDIHSFRSESTLKSLFTSSAGERLNRAETNRPEPRCNLLSEFLGQYFRVPLLRALLRLVGRDDPRGKDRVQQTHGRASRQPRRPDRQLAADPRRAQSDASTPNIPRRISASDRTC